MHPRKLTILSAVSLAAILLLPAALVPPAHAHEQSAAPHSGAQAIAHVMKAQFDRPDAPLKVVSVTVDGDHAMAGWIQQDKGGRALLKAQGGKWTIHVCGGDGLLQASALEMAGIAAPAAKRLIQKVVAAEKRLPADQLKKLALFEGMVKIEGGSHHGHGAAHRHHK
jgi:hypothetical protein